jgi:SAM-dependent methyltransferase
MTATPETLHKFVTFCQQHITGDEKGQAQVFLDRFFQAFGHDGALEAGATYEQRIKKGSKKGSKKGKTGFADLVWKPRVLIEMKKRGETLAKHYSQAFDYWVRLVSDRPRYVILCNFDEFWIFDFNLQVDTPVDKVTLEQLPERISAFTFMELTDRKPVFNNNQIEVTETAGRRMGELFQELRNRGKNKNLFDEKIAQRFVLQCVLAMFAEDRGMLPRDLFVSCVRDCLDGANYYDILGGLLREMNQPGRTPAGRFQGVDYFNGGLFSVIDPIELEKEELKILEVCALQDWSKVRPAIFGNIFESAIDKQQRHARGIHYTSEIDIMKIVSPTINRYWREKIEAANTLKELNQLQLELQSYRVLDPACGSGNFLYLAYQQLKVIEQELLEKIASLRRSNTEQMQISFVTPQQFFGMDINPFAVELARVTLTIARKIAIDNLGLNEPALPLDSLDKNIVCRDALFEPWPRVNAIIGNPPFLGGKHTRIALGDEYMDKVFARFGDVKDSVDFCCYWFRIAHDNLGENDRAGLVGTNSISQNKSRLASLEYICKNGGYIGDAISTQPWSGEAKVHVSIVNWSLQKPENYYLDKKEVARINSSLTDAVDVTSAVKLKVNKNMCFQGVIPVGKGFIVTEEEVNKWIELEPKNRDVLKLFSMGANLAKNPHGKPDRWIIDLNDMSLEDASNYPLPLERIKATVKPERDNNRREVTRVNWWKFGEKRPAMRKAIAPLSYYFTVPRVSKWAIFIPAPINWLPGDKSVVVASEDFYILGLLLSKVHRLWMHAQKSTLGTTPAYTHNTCFETFPFPQTPTEETVAQIRTAAEELHQYRTEQMEAKQWGITKLYNQFFNEPASKLYRLHSRLDELAMEAYGFAPKDDILEKLLELNRELARRES